MITADGEDEVLCDSDIPRDIAVDFGTSGTLDEWISNIDKLYNRPGAEPFQFGLCHSMGSALVELMGSSTGTDCHLRLLGMGVQVSLPPPKLHVGSTETPSSWRDRLANKVPH